MRWALAIFGIVGRDGGTTLELAEACVLIPTVAAERITPHTEGMAAVVWHLLVSHPSLAKVGSHEVGIDPLESSGARSQTAFALIRSDRGAYRFRSANALASSEAARGSSSPRSRSRA